jgi:hypothetical protein
VNPRALLPPLIAIVILVVIGMQTSEALRQSGTWRSPARRVDPVVDPYATLDRALASRDTALATSGLRDPFDYGRAPGPTGPRKPRIAVPTPPPVPVVTAIVTDAEAARAILRYEGTSYSVKIGDLFAQYRVVNITADQVVVDDGSNRLVLKRPSKGE